MMKNIIVRETCSVIISKGSTSEAWRFKVRRVNVM